MSSAGVSHPSSSNRALASSSLSGPSAVMTGSAGGAGTSRVRAARVPGRVGGAEAGRAPVVATAPRWVDAARAGEGAGCGEESGGSSRGMGGPWIGRTDAMFAWAAEGTIAGRSRSAWEARSTDDAPRRRALAASDEPVELAPDDDALERLADDAREGDDLLHAGAVDPVIAAITEESATRASARPAERARSPRRAAARGPPGARPRARRRGPWSRRGRAGRGRST